MADSDEGDIDKLLKELEDQPEEKPPSKKDIKDYNYDDDDIPQDMMID